MNTKEILEKALESAKQNGEALMVIHWNNHKLNYMKQGEDEALAGSMALMLGDGLEEKEDAKRDFALMFIVAAASVEGNGLPVVELIKGMAKKL